MSSAKARTMPGVMELLPLDQIAFQGMMDTIRRNFERFGFLPIETPAIEFSNVLLTKSGGETERQVYFVQSTGSLKQGDEPDLALRFDLTVPLARYVAEHEAHLTFPFRRYQMQRVYRGESAQRGRFREFYQCDIDVIGKDTLSVRFDAELPAVIYAIFRELRIGPFCIQMNNRNLMRGFFHSLGIDSGEQQMLVLREVDKLDKRGASQVRDTLTGAGFALAPETVATLLAFVGTRSTGHDDAMLKLDAIDCANELIVAGVAQLREVLNLVRALGVPDSHYALNFSIARGLDYYTGTVYETTLNEHPEIGSICSGGRYENLASHYTKSKLPGVGISIGATRLFWQLQQAGLVTKGRSHVQVLVAQMDEANLPQYLELGTQLRLAGINTEVQLESKKLARQFQYADRAGIRFVAVLGADEIAKGTVSVKDMRRQEQFEVARAELIKTLRVEIEQGEVMDTLEAQVSP
ncbi:MAG: histidine--tRNA ligase [Pseudomonadota bacterium]|nr:histidine--tRNA ligase [Pseudomonadota bacterium]